MLVDLSMGDAGGFKSEDMWGPSSDPAWKRNDPMVNMDSWSPTAPASGSTAVTATRRTSTRAPVAGNLFNAKFLEGFTLRTNKTFQEKYIAAGGKNGVFNLPSNGTHSWGYWGSQLQQMKPDIQRVLGARRRRRGSCGRGRLGAAHRPHVDKSRRRRSLRGSPPSAVSGAARRGDVVHYIAGSRSRGAG